MISARLSHQAEGSYYGPIDAHPSSPPPAPIVASFTRMPQLSFWQPSGSHYIDASANYEPNPMYKVNISWLRSQCDHSVFASAFFTDIIRGNTSINLAPRDFRGVLTSEYGRGKSLNFAYYPWFFENCRPPRPVEEKTSLYSSFPAEVSANK